MDAFLDDIFRFAASDFKSVFSGWGIAYNGRFHLSLPEVALASGQDRKFSFFLNGIALGYQGGTTIRPVASI
jgi:hypothetical protein